MKISELLYDSSRILADKALELVKNDTVLLEEFIRVSFEEKYPLNMRASRVLGLLPEFNSAIFQQYSSEIIKQLPNVESESVLRNLLRPYHLDVIELNEEDESILLELSFRLFSDANNSPGVRNYALHIIRIFVKKYPEIANEFCAILENEIENGDGSFKYIAKKIYSELQI